MGAFKLGKMTFGSMFKKPETVLYPLETKPQPAGLKGHIALDVQTCILCGMCERNCATDCITVDKQNRAWKIDRLQCIQCGYCITVCPKKSLSMDPNYAPATTVHTIDVVEVPDQVNSSIDAPAADTEKTQELPVQKAAEPVSAQPAEETAALPPDPQLDALIGLMDESKAQKVKEVMQALR